MSSYTLDRFVFKNAINFSWFLQPNYICLAGQEVCTVFDITANRMQIYSYSFIEVLHLHASLP